MYRREPSSSVGREGATGSSSSPAMPTTGPGSGGGSIVAAAAAAPSVVGIRGYLDLFEFDAPITGISLQSQHIMCSFF